MVPINGKEFDPTDQFRPSPPPISAMSRVSECIGVLISLVFASAVLLAMACVFLWLIVQFVALARAIN